MKIHIPIIIIMAIVSGGIMMTVAYISAGRLDKVDKQHHEFCTGVRMSMHEDSRDLESGDKIRQEAARLKFFDSQIVYHGSQSIAMCVDKLPSIPTNCVANADYACLAKIAHGIEIEIEQ